MLYKALILFMLCFTWLGAVETTGTLIVSYHTGRNADRLDRVRFWLTNERNKAEMYPKAGSYAEDPLEHLRRVVISNLPEGRYVIAFVIPNHDGLFGEIAKREVIVHAGELTKVHQAIKPRYCCVQAEATFAEASPTQPVISLIDRRGTLQAYTSSGKLVCGDLYPGDYTLIFESEKGYVTPDPLHFQVTAGATAGPFQRVYQPKPMVVATKATPSVKKKLLLK